MGVMSESCVGTRVAPGSRPYDPFSLLADARTASVIYADFRPLCRDETSRLCLGTVKNPTFCWCSIKRLNALVLRDALVLSLLMSSFRNSRAFVPWRAWSSFLRGYLVNGQILCKSLRMFLGFTITSGWRISRKSVNHQSLFSFHCVFWKLCSSVVVLSFIAVSDCRREESFNDGFCQQAKQSNQFMRECEMRENETGM